MAIAHGTDRKYRDGCRCDPCRTSRNRRQREYSARRATAGRPIHKSRRRVKALCEHCGSGFRARADQVGRFCSLGCANDAQGRRPARKSPSRKRAERRAAKAAAGSTGGKRVWVQGNCLVCEVSFSPSPGLAARYCSASCRAVARAGGRWIDYATRVSIYRAADWRCSICERETLRTFVQGDPLSPTLDHVTPRSRGGSDDPSNLRLACSACNSLRGDLTHHTDASVRAALAA